MSADEPPIRPPYDPMGTDAVGVGPHSLPWPEDPRLDPALLAAGDSRNVIDRFRYWTVEAIVADLDTTRHSLHVAIENFSHDLNIGTIVRTANAMNVAGVHIVGRRRWNRRGAMVTDRYVRVSYHPNASVLSEWAHGRGLPLIGVDNIEGSRPLETYDLPPACVLLLGQESAGLTAAAIAACDVLLAITQYGSTRSLNASTAGAIAMYEWVRQHATPPP